MAFVGPLSFMIPKTLSVICMTSTTVRLVPNSGCALNTFSAENTIITLADWYHQVSLQVAKSPIP